MKKIILCFAVIFYMLSCKQAGSANQRYSSSQPGVDTNLAAFIKSIKAVDNHAHPNMIDTGDKGSDALPLDGLGDIELPARVLPASPDWLMAYKAMYGFKGTEINQKEMPALVSNTNNLVKEKGEKFPAWVLDQSGIEVMLANRIFMGGGVKAPRFRWVTYVDALLFPLSNKEEASVTPDREKLFPLEAALLKKYLADLNIAKLPPTLDEYLQQVVTGTLEAQKKGGCVALKFEAAYLRSLNFAKVEKQPATEVYAHFLNGGEPSHEQYKLLQDFIFRYLAREAGRLSLAVHIHSFPAAGNYFVAQDCDPLLLESVFNDPELRNTKFVIIHGGGTFWQHTSAMLWKPNVYADISLLTRLWSAEQLSFVLRDWLSQFPGKVLFGTDAVAFGPGLGWELNAWIGAATAREAIAIALSGMVHDKEISAERAKEIAVMVMRTNAGNLYHLGLK